MRNIRANSKKVLAFSMVVLVLFMVAGFFYVSNRYKNRHVNSASKLMVHDSTRQDRRKYSIEELEADNIHSEDENQEMKNLRSKFEDKCHDEKVLARNMVTRGQCRTLVIVIGQLRASNNTWDSFQNHVLEPLSADLFVCASPGGGDVEQDPFYVRAKRDTKAFTYRVKSEDLTVAADEAAVELGVEPGQIDYLRDISNNWLGGLIELNGAKREGSGLYLAHNRWICLKEGEDLWAKYDRFVITRSDLYWLHDHIPTSMLAGDAIWTTEGQEYAGVNDRHMVCSSSNIRDCLSVFEAIVYGKEYGKRLTDAGFTAFNNERWLKDFYLWRGHTLRRMPSLSFLVKGTADVARWTTSNQKFDEDVLVKYPSEKGLADARHEQLASGNMSIATLLDSIATGTCWPPCV